MWRRGGLRRHGGKLAGVFACVLALPSPGAAQSLGGAAEKERERREKVRQTGRQAPLRTDADLQTTKGQVANDPGAQAAPGGDGENAVERGRVTLDTPPQADSEVGWLR